MIARTEFEQLVRKLGQSMKKDLCWQKNAILALRTASEGYLYEIMEKSSSIASHAKRRTTQPKVINVVR